VGAGAASPAAQPHRLARRCPQTCRGGDQNLTTPTTSRSPSPRRRARRGEGERLRADILAAATRLLAEAGDSSGVSIRAVADAVGVTPPSIYLHFADKDELIWEVCEEQFRKFDEHVGSRTAGIEDPVENIRACGRAYVEFGLSNAEGYRILFMGRGQSGAKHEHTSMEHVSPTLDRVVDNLRRGMETGQIAKGDPALVALGLWTVVHGITSLLISLPDFPWPVAREVMVDRVIDQGLAPLSSLHRAHGEALHEAVEEEVVDQRHRHGDDHRRGHQ
jgi:AcrR family transcriptional regulator